MAQNDPNKLTVSEDKLQVFFNGLVPVNSVKTLADELCEEAESRKISRFPQRDEVYRILSEAVHEKMEERGEISEESPSSEEESGDDAASEKGEATSETNAQGDIGEETEGNQGNGGEEAGLYVNDQSKSNTSNEVADSDEDSGEEVLVENLRLCSGEKPKDPVNGYISWGRDFFSTDYETDEFGRVNYRVQRGDPSVDENEFLAEVFPGARGESGRDVFGTELPGENPKRAALSAGKNVITEDADDGRQFFYAETPGRIRYGKGKLAVDHEYVVDGNVGLRTGHIDHPGAVKVKGDVEPGAKVAARGDVEIAGTVEAADIDAGGSVWVREGVSHVGDKGVNAGGNVVAKYLRNTYVEAGENVEIANEIVHSSVYCRGMVDVGRGRIMGGKTVALQGGNIAQLGSVSEVETSLCVAYDAIVLRYGQEKEEEVKENERLIEKIDGYIEGTVGHMEELSQKQREAVNQLVERAEELKKENEQIKEEIQQLIEDTENRKSKCECKIQKRVYPEVFISYADLTNLHVIEERPGMVRVRIQEDDEGNAKVVLEP